MKNIKKPLITFALMAYNSERFIEEAVAGALSQTYEPLEIILSDDCSQDRTFAIIEKLVSEYRGRHTIRVNRNKENVGVSGHVNRIMEMCSGEIMVIAAADDVSLPDRTQKTWEAYVNSGRKAMSIHSSCIVIDEAGAEICKTQAFDHYDAGLESIIDHGSWLYGCTHAWHRVVFDRFGPLPLEITQEDEVIPFRSLLLGTIRYVKEPLVRYRVHGSNLSNHTRGIARTREEFKELTANQYRQKLNNQKCYLSDLETAGSMVEDGRRVRLTNNLLRTIKLCELELAVRGKKIEVKLPGLVRDIVKLHGVDGALIAKLLFRVLLPETFIRYSFYKYKKTLIGRDLSIAGRY